MLPLHDAYEVVLFSPYGQAQEPFAPHLRVGADEAFDVVSVGCFVAYALSQADAAVLYAIDEDALCPSVSAEEVVHRLDDDAEGAHEH